MTAAPEGRIDRRWVMACGALLLAGLLAPMFVIHIRFSEDRVVDEFVRAVVLPLLGAEPATGRPAGKSITSGVVALLAAPGIRLKLLGLLLGAFSILMPTAKLVHLATYSDGRMPAGLRRRARAWTGWAVTAGLYSYVDLLVVAALASTFLSFPGGTRINPGAGLWCYWAYIIVVNLLIHRVAPPRH